MSNMIFISVIYFLHSTLYTNLPLALVYLQIMSSKLAFLSQDGTYNKSAF